jgi:[acyl-carrier-protein] S-malonyltransferase
MKLAFVFPGQGSQSIGMLNGFSGNAAVVRTMQAASAALDQDIERLIAQGPDSELGATVNTQPVMLATGFAYFQAWREAGGLQPHVVAGHSLGEYTALVAASALDLLDALKLVRVRARAMQEAVPAGEGGMAAILGLDNDAVLSVCTEASASGVVEAVNYNAPMQVVIAGTKPAIDKACEIAKEKGAKRAIVLAVSAPFHSSLMKPAAMRLADAMKSMNFAKPAFDVINNVDVRIEHDSEAIKDALVRQAWHPVRWVESIQHMQRMGVTHVIECGPGKVLQGLTRRIAPEMQSLAVFDAASLQQTLEAVA